MCGIAGISGLSAEAGERYLRDMVDEMDYRGPDDRGFWARDQFAFGMCRLSIIDPEGGHQPMWIEGEVGIVFNGEIYNYRTLRDQLSAEGYEFQTKSDTEVVLKAYHHKGLEALEQLNGMFAMALYDGRREKIHLARDRLGIKPLYYGFFDGDLFFASEIKSILRAVEERPSLDQQAIYDYLTLRFVPSGRSMWKGIEKLKPGHTLTLNLNSGQHTTSTYWENHFESSEVDPGRNYPGEFEELFLHSVEQRLEAADVPVGTLLSGGLDSSAVSAAAVELGHDDFHTFNVAFDGGGEYDESRYARMMAEATGSRHHEISIGEEEFLKFLPDLVRFTDEPLADLASVPLFYVSKLARADVKVVLSGEGSDEILAGYDFDQLAATFDRLARMDRILPKVVANLLAWLSPIRKYREAFKGLAAGGVGEILKHRLYHMTYHWTDDEKKRLWTGDPSVEQTEAQMIDWYRHTSSEHPIDQIQEVYCGEWLVEDLLMKADRMTMANSLELRVPFLDHNLVEWAQSLPLEWKVGSKKNGYTTKRILRDFCRGRIPDEIIDRPKQGFPVPAYEWLKGGAGDWVEEKILGRNSRVLEFVNPTVVQSVLREARQGNYDSAHKIWTLVILELWLRHWT